MMLMRIWRMRVFNDQKVRFYLWATIAIVFILLLVSVVIIDNNNKISRKALLEKAVIISNSINVYDLLKLNTNKTDAYNTAYQNLKTQLLHINNSDSSFQYLYLMGKNLDGDIFFFMDSQIQKIPILSSSRILYSDAAEPFHQIFIAKKESVFGPIEDSRGNNISALIPIFHPTSGGLIAVLGVDVLNSVWKQQLFQQSIFLLIFIYTILLILFSFILIRTNSRIKILKKERKFFKLFQNSPTIAGLSELESGVFIEVNHAFCDKLGFTHEEVIGKPVQDILKLEEIIEGPVLAKLKAKGFIRSEETTICSRNDICIHVLLSAEVITLGKKKYNFTTAVDISDRINAEEKLTTAYEKKNQLNKELMSSREEVKRLLTAVEQSANVIVITDLLGVIEYVNPKFTQTTGYEKQEVLGKKPSVLNARTQPAAMYKELWETISSGEIWKGEFHNKTLFDDYYWESAIISPVKNEQGQITHYIGIKEDITEKKKLIAELVQAKEDAEESERVKSSFLANMSHEIRTPINGILGFTELLHNTGLMEEESKQFLGIIERSGLRMLGIINNLIDFSKVETSQIKVQQREYNLKEQLDYLYSFYKPEMERKGLALQLVNNLSIQDVVVYSDQEKIYAILTNLIDNAMKFTHEGEVEVSCSRKNGSIAFCVRDTGIGIPKSRQKLIFDRFVQVDLEDKIETNGAGLGLAIAKAYVDVLGGEIWVESVEEQGSSFYFDLPLKKPEINRDIAWIGNVRTEENQNTLPKLKILIAEDNKISFLLLQNMLKDIAKEIILATNGLEAITLFKENRDVDLVLMDIKMPKINGYQVVRAIREIDEQVVIIAQTAYAFADDKQKAINVGCNDYVSKPIDRDELLISIKEQIILSKLQG